MPETALILIECQDGDITQSSLRMLTAARSITDGPVHAVLIGHDLESCAEQIAASGVDAVHVVDHAEYEQYRVLPYTRAMESAIDASAASLVLMATTSMSRDLAPRLAARRSALLATDCLTLELHGDANQADVSFAWTWLSEGGEWRMPCRSSVICGVLTPRSIPAPSALEGCSEELLPRLGDAEGRLRARSEALGPASCSNGSTSAVAQTSSPNCHRKG